MNLKQIQNNKYVRFFSNRFVLIFIAFVVWMLFFDENSFLVDRKFNQEINKLESDKEFYHKGIEIDKEKIKTLEDPEKLDKFAREKYKMKKENEDIYIIEFDTIQ